MIYLLSSCRMGMKPRLEVVDIAEIFAGTEGTKKFREQVVVGMFATLGRKVIKSPAFQPRLQVANVDALRVSSIALFFPLPF